MKNKKRTMSQIVTLSSFFILLAIVAEAERQRPVVVTRGFYLINREVDSNGNLVDNGGMSNNTREIHFTRSDIRITSLRDFTNNLSKRRQVYRNYLVGMNVNGYEVTSSLNIVRKPSRRLRNCRAFHRQLTVVNPRIIVQE